MEKMAEIVVLFILLIIVGAMV
ncbi:YjcZ family sporulation protein [Bacillus sp. X1(2014)]